MVRGTAASALSLVAVAAVAHHDGGTGSLGRAASSGGAGSSRVIVGGQGIAAALGASQLGGKTGVSGSSGSFSTGGAAASQGGLVLFGLWLLWLWVATTSIGSSRRGKQVRKWILFFFLAVAVSNLAQEGTI